MEEKIKGAIFDLDGTIVNSMGMWRKLDKEFFIRQGVEYSPEISKEIVGMTLEQAAEHFSKTFNLGKTTKQILDEWNDYLLDQYKNVIPLKPYADRLIELWSRQGIKMCVATLTEKKMAEIILKKYGLLDKFEFILTVAEVGKSKLSPDIYLKCAEKMGLLPNECIVLEDTYHAMKSAKGAGFTVYAVDEPTARNKEGICAICDKYINTFEEIL